MIDVAFVTIGLFGVYLWTRPKKNYFSKVLTPEMIDAIIIVSVDSGVFFIERKLRQKKGVFK